MKIRTLFVNVAVLTAFLSGCTAPNPESESPGSDGNPAIVVLNFEALSGQEETLRTELVALIDSVRHEPHFINIRMHTGAEDPGRILLYEVWDDVDYFTGAHMQTSYIQAFMEKSSTFLAGPPEITFWNLRDDFQPPADQ